MWEQEEAPANEHDERVGEPERSEDERPRKQRQRRRCEVVLVVSHRCKKHERGEERAEDPTPDGQHKVNEHRRKCRWCRGGCLGRLYGLDPLV